MSHRIFATVKRGPMDLTAVCVFPWELEILQLIHTGEVKEVSIEQMADVQEGVVKIDRVKLKQHAKLKAGYAPDLREQLEIMMYVAPEEDPCLDPGSEYMRLSDKYGMDKELPISCVERIYGQLQAGGFAAKLKEFESVRVPKPKSVSAAEAGFGKPVERMTISEARAELDRLSIAWSKNDKLPDLRVKLEEATTLQA